MRGIGSTFSRLPSARAFIAGAAILTGAFTSDVHGQSSRLGKASEILTRDVRRADEVAWAVPRGRTTGVALPRPLAAGDAVTLRQIFALQVHGDAAAASKFAAGLEDPLLQGTVLASRYLDRRYRASVDELSDWLSQYRDLPDAPAIYALLISRLPKGEVAPPKPKVMALPRATDPDPLPEDIEPPRHDIARHAGLDRRVMERAQRGNGASALNLIATSHGVSADYAGQLRAEVAQVLFTRNENAEALHIAQAALADVDHDNSLARHQPSLCFYIGGLAAWRLGRVELARDLFTAGVNAVRTTPRVHAASAYWASRASRALRDPAGAQKFLHVAAGEQLTLHGMLARHQLGLDASVTPGGEVLGQADIDAIGARQGGRRAYALLQIGQSDRAEAELRVLWPAAEDNPALARSLLLVAAAAGLTDCAAQMATRLEPRDGHRHDALRFPVPRLRPAGGFIIDPALVYAVTRIESNFDADAVSPVGARGLMQIMPTTAQYIMGDVPFAARRLHEPGSNLDIGQRYIVYLAALDGIDNDLMRLLASYNAGPGNFARWGADIRDQGDPLLFIEAIPVPETRAFVQHALMYSWIYASRMHLPAGSLDSLAAGDFPRFAPGAQDSRIASLAADLH